MSINTVSVVGPRAQPVEQKKEKESDVDKILKGLQIANGVLGIGSNIQQIRENQSTIEKNDYDVGQKKAAADRKEKGILLPAEVATLQTTNDVSFSPMQDAVQLRQMDGSVLWAKAKGKPEPRVDTTSADRLKLDREKLDYQKERDAKLDAEKKAATTRGPSQAPSSGAPEVAEAAKKTPAQIKSDNEANYRYESLKKNAEKLRGLVAKEGTMSFTGPEGAAMDKLIYETAIDYAKLVDPESIAREGEVATAKKYMLPFREWGGATTSNETAIAQIDDYLAGLDQRLEARAKAFNSPLPEGFGAKKGGVEGGWLVEDATAAPTQGKLDPQIEQYAKSNNLDYQAAKSILTGRGYKPNE